MESIPTQTQPSVDPNVSTPDYIYDYNDTEAHIPLEELIPVAFVYGTTLLFGISGNGLVIFSIARYRRMRTITNTFLLSLASADLLLVCICIPVKFAAFFSFSWEFGEFLCKSVHYLQNVSAICSVSTLTVMSVERYYAIMHPMKAKYVCTASRTRKVIISVWILSLILASPIIVGKVHKEVGEKKKAYWCVNEWSQVIFSKLYEFYMLCIILMFPVSIMSFAYASICKELWAVSFTRSAMQRGENGTEPDLIARNRYQNQQLTSEKSPFYRPRLKMATYSTSEDKTRKQVIKMLVIIIVLFLLCWAPILINNVLVAYGVLSSLHYGYLKPMRQAFFLMAYANSCVNPIVYGFMSKNFRETFQHALCSCIRGKEYARRMRFERHNSTLTRSTNLGYTREIQMEELEAISKTESYGSCCPDNV